MRIVKVCFLLFIFNYGFSSCALAGNLDQHMQNFLGELGVKSNVTRGHVYQDQSAGYMTGGSFFGRAPIKNMDLVHIDMPHANFGCNKIDIFKGGFGFAKGQEYIDMCKAVASDSAGYAAELALQTVSPQLHTALNSVLSKIQSMNALNINSCHAAATLMAGVLPRSNATQATFCQTLSRESGLASDYVSAKHGCKEPQQKMKSLIANNPKYKDMLIGDYNIAWEALKKNKFIVDENVHRSSVAEFFMSISGTIINTVLPNGETRIEHKSSLATNDYFLETFLKGGNARFYQCDDKEKCLSLKIEDTLFPPEKSFHHRVRDIINKISDKIWLDEESLKEDEINFIESTSVPIFQILNIQTAFKRGQSPLDLEDHVEMIATDLLFHYLTEILDIVDIANKNLSTIQLSDDQSIKFQKEIRQVRYLLRQKQKGYYYATNQKFSLIQQANQYEKILFSTAAKEHMM